MEINLSCLGTVGKTIAFDLCYLSAICIHKRLLFIIIVFFYYLRVLSLAFFRHILSVLFPFLCHIMPCDLGCLILAWPWGKLPNRDVAKHKILNVLSLKWQYIFFYIKNGSHDLYVKWVSHSDTELSLNSAVPLSARLLRESYSSLFWSSNSFGSLSALLVLFLAAAGSC